LNLIDNKPNHQNILLDFIKKIYGTVKKIKEYIPVKIVVLPEW